MARSDNLLFDGQLEPWLAVGRKQERLYSAMKFTAEVFCILLYETTLLRINKHYTYRREYHLMTQVIPCRYLSHYLEYKCSDLQYHSKMEWNDGAAQILFEHMNMDISRFTKTRYSLAEHGGLDYNENYTAMYVYLCRWSIK